MKKIVSIFLLLQFLTGNAFAEELVKLPTLFTHFYHHSQEHDDNDNFLDFVVEHYSDNHEKEEHQEDKDCHLPFKHCDGCCVNAHIPLIGFTPNYDVLEFNLTISTNNEYFFENEKAENACCFSIWQPPKIS